MAFTLRNLENHAGSGSGRKVFTYYTTDAPATYLAAGYFNTADMLLSAGDIVLVIEDSLPPVMLNVESISSGVVTMGGGGWATEEGASIAAAAAAIFHNVWREGAYIRSQIRIDLTGLRSTAGGDIIGDDGSALAAYIGQVTAARNGTITHGTVHCLEVPAGGDPDINLYSATEATGAEDDAISGLTGTQLLNAGDWTVGLSQALTALPANDEYLYLVAGATTDADYTTGILVVDLWGQ